MPVKFQRTIPSKMWEEIHFKVDKIVIFGTSKFKLSHSIKLHASTDFQLVITLTEINIFDRCTKHLADYVDKGVKLEIIFDR